MMRQIKKLLKLHLQQQSLQPISIEKLDEADLKQISGAGSKTGATGTDPY